jgi:hypothetical protein
VLAYLSRYTHRVAIANSRLIAFDDNGVTFKWNDYRAEGRERRKIMTLATDEFIRRFLIHALPRGFHRIATTVSSPTALAPRTSCGCASCSVRPFRKTHDADARDATEPQTLSCPCPCCGGRMIIIETFARGCSPRTRPAGSIRTDTS